MSQQILSISQLNEYIRAMMDQDHLLSSVAVKGEISNYKVYPSGHHYFTLKDEGGALKCVMFRGNAIRLRFRPEDGMQVLATGRVSVYPRDGAYQLYCTGLVVDGVGDLYVAFEQLKNKLAGLGLFDQSHKKPLPAYPQTIGLITSSAGAAVHDMLRILNKRFSLCKVRLLPVRVQGVEAPEEIATAIYYCNDHKLADLLIVGRGGGSIEDLWAFNDEKVAYAIFQSRIPVISAVGHEPDVTIADFVADVRAATPSNGAELAVPDREGLQQMLDSALSSMTAALQHQINGARKHLGALAASPALRSPDAYYRQLQNNLNLIRNRMLAAQNQQISSNQHRFVSNAAKLDALSPLKVLSRGYALVEAGEKNLVRAATQLSVGDTVNITFSDGTVAATVTQVKEIEQ